jgi:hypothetical protein
MDLGGNFVVVWAGQFRDGDEYGVFGRRFDASGAPLATEFQVNTTTTGPQRRPDVSLLPGGGFVVAWDGPLGGGNRVFGRLYDANGAPQGDEFTLGSAALAQSGVDLSSPGGGFVAAWTSYGQDGSHNAVMARRFNSLATPLGEEFLVNTYTTNSQAFPVVASGSFSGSFVVAWESFGQDGSMDGVFGQRFGATGARRGAEFRLNSYTTAAQRHVALASDRAGNLAAAWTSDGGQDGSNAVIGRRFQGLFPAGLAVTAEGNGVLEVNEDFGLATSWRNASGAAQTFQGAASVLTLGGTASYGTVADGAVGTCSGLCFSGGLTGTRGAGHTDLSFLETIEPDVQGQQKRWFLHVGDSFTDVPRTNPFYRFIETLLHHGVTTGCAANTYCPSGPTTREGMAVFVLAAKEGTLYTPPACTTPVFADVPASSPFCRWVEELARRGVVSGCATGRYCPGDAVTREQMAVFVLRTLDEDLDPPACTTPVFSDVPADSPFCRWIEELVRRGVVSGCAAGRYCPTQAVSREQMGVFISVTFGLNLYGP